MGISFVIAILAAIVSLVTRQFLTTEIYFEYEKFRIASIWIAVFLIARRDLDHFKPNETLQTHKNEYLLRVIIAILFIPALQLFNFSHSLLSFFSAAIISYIVLVTVRAQQTTFTIGRNSRKIEEILLLSCLSFIAFISFEILTLVYGIAFFLGIGYLIFYGTRPSVKGVLTINNFRFYAFLSTILADLIFIRNYALFDLSEAIAIDFYTKLIGFPILAIQTYLTAKLAFGYDELSLKPLYASLCIIIITLLALNSPLTNLIDTQIVNDLSSLSLMSLLLIGICFCVMQWASLWFFKQFSQDGQTLFIYGCFKIILVILASITFNQFTTYFLGYYLVAIIGYFTIYKMRFKNA